MKGTEYLSSHQVKNSPMYLYYHSFPISSFKILVLLILILQTPTLFKDIGTGFSRSCPKLLFKKFRITVFTDYLPM